MKLELQMRENTELRLHMKELQLADRAQPGSEQPQDDFPVKDSSLEAQNKKLKAEVKAAYSELAEVKQSIAMKDRRIAQLQSKNTVIMSQAGNAESVYATQKGSSGSRAFYHKRMNSKFE